ncbi:MAG: hypothetical protein HY064_13155 [Bacteroidetes bacterium]|nr:hypothetical protein [Bacteroidota bacterium]
MLFFLSGAFTFSFAQNTTRCLVIERMINGKVDSAYGLVQLKTGDAVMVRTTTDHHLQTGTITAITDSTIELSSIHTVVISRITEIRWGPKDGRNKYHGAGIVVSGLASTLFAFYQFAHGTGSLIGVYIIGGITLVALAVVGYLSYRSGKIAMKEKRRIKNSNWKIISVPVDAAIRFPKRSAG